MTLMIEEEVIDKHLQICKRICDNRQYTELNFQRENIKTEVLKSFDRNGYDLIRISRLLEKFDKAIFYYLDTYVMNRGSRPLSWPDYHEDSIRAEMLYEVMYTLH